MGYAQTWDLEVFFAGGSQSPQFKAFLKQLENDLEGLPDQVAQLKSDAAKWETVLSAVQDVASRMRQASAFVSCLASQNMKDEAAKLLSGRIAQLQAALATVQTSLDERIVALSESDWQRLLQTQSLAELAFPLQERRERAKEKLPAAQEALAGDLAVDGYHGWSDLYNTIVGRMSITWSEAGETRSLSIGQAANKLASPDRAVRQAMFSKWEAAWAEEAELCATALNHLAGFRLNLYRKRGWSSVLKEPLAINRMQLATLEAMWDAVERSKPRLLAYLERKARLLGVERLAWHDVPAPLAAEAGSIGYDEAAAFILEQFGRFSPDMAHFAERAFAQRWIEAEDRPAKRPGGFCTSFPESKQSRIFMTFAGTASNLYTLAHELGHAYHQHVMNDLPQMAQRYAMNVAETASTFAETVVMDAAYRHAATDAERLALLEEKAQNAIAFFMNIRARFLFETAFYDARREGPLSLEALNRLMTDAQRIAYGDALAEYHPHFWASKLHFYITGVPFYNFPYTFGYLFSQGIYHRATADGRSFADRYVALLRDTGRMTVEDLAAKHLGVDLTGPAFWDEAVGTALADIDRFLALTEAKA